MELSLRHRSTAQRTTAPSPLQSRSSGRSSFLRRLLTSNGGLQASQPHPTQGGLALLLTSGASHVAGATKALQQRAEGLRAGSHVLVGGVPARQGCRSSLASAHRLAAQHADSNSNSNYYSNVSKGTAVGEIAKMTRPSPTTRPMEPSEWEPVRNPDGTEDLLFVPGNNRSRKNYIGKIQKQLVDEGVPNWNASTLAPRLEVGYPNGPTTTASPSTNIGYGNAARNTADPTTATQIAKLQAVIAANKEFGEPTDRLESKLRELQSLQSAPDTKRLSCAAAKRVLEQTKAAQTSAGRRRSLRCKESR